MSRRDHLQQIISIAEKLRANITTHDVVQPCTATAPPLFPPLRLSSLTSAFCSEIANYRFLPQIRQALLARVTELASVYQNSYERSCQRLSTLPTSSEDPSNNRVIEKLRITFEKLFEQNGLPQFLKDACSAQTSYDAQLQTCRKSQVRPIERRPFNHVSLCSA